MKRKTPKRLPVRLLDLDLVAEFSANTSLTMIKPEQGEYALSTRQSICSLLQQAGIEVRRSHPYCIILAGDIRQHPVWNKY